jgi:serine/threonine-protein kinase
LDSVQARLHQAELAESAAKAKAVEEAKRRRLTLALAATVLLALTLGGGAWLWFKADRDARQTALTRDVNDALNKSTALREQAKATNAGSAALFGQAREQAQRALVLVQSGPVDAALRTQVQQLQTEFDDEEKDRTLLAALDAARLAPSESVVGGNRFASGRAVPFYREALRAYGLPDGEGKPAEVAERIRQRPPAVRDAVAATLDEWIDIATDPINNLTEPHLDWLKAVAAAVEPAEGWTRDYRVSREEKDVAKRREALEKLAATPEVQKLPPRAVTLLATRLRYAGAGTSTVRLLRLAQEQWGKRYDKSRRPSERKRYAS